MRIARFLVFMGVLCSGVSGAGQCHAQQSPFVVDLAADYIDVSVGFSGSSIALFGHRKDKNTDIAIVVEGPERDVTIWKKSRVMGAWVNRDYAHFEDVPLYYSYALSAPILMDQDSDMMRDNRIGINSLFKGAASAESEDVKDVSEFKQSLITKRQTQGIFPLKPAEIQFLNDYFFRVSFSVPPSVPTGEYRIYSYLLKHGKIVQRDVEVLRVEQIGVNAFILYAAQKHGFWYSIACIVLALLSGWLASAVRVKT